MIIASISLSSYEYKERGFQSNLYFSICSHRLTSPFYHDNPHSLLIKEIVLKFHLILSENLDIKRN